MKALLKKYAELQARVNELETQRDTLKAEILDALKKEKLEKVESDYGKFTMSRRVSWSYSEAIQKLEEKLKIKKIEETEKGIATPKETVYLTFTPVKHDT